MVSSDAGPLESPQTGLRSGQSRAPPCGAMRSGTLEPPETLLQDRGPPASGGAGACPWPRPAGELLGQLLLSLELPIYTNRAFALGPEPGFARPGFAQLGFTQPPTSNRHKTKSQ